ncbi:MAG: hypothetical protein JOY61_23885 [Chloroflexi bacterium]|nr:hypothetical protein [Chloroflexota bacterium]
MKGSLLRLLAYAVGLDISTCRFILIAGGVGYLAYSDRPRPGWYGFGWYGITPQAFQFVLGFGLLLLPYSFVAGLLVLAIVRALEWLRFPRLSVTIAGSLTAAVISALIVLGIGWYIALSGIAVYVPAVLSAS